MKQKKDIVCSGVFAAMGALVGAFSSWFAFMCVAAGEQAWCAAVLLVFGVIGVACCGYISHEVDY